MPPERFIEGDLKIRIMKIWGDKMMRNNYLDELGGTDELVRKHYPKTNRKQSLCDAWVRACNDITRPYSKEQRNESIGK